MKRMMVIAITVAFGVSLLWLSGCGNSTPQTGAAPQAEPPVPPGLFLAQAPGNALNVSAAKKDAKEGEEIALRGQIAGKKEPLVSGQAVFLLADLSLQNCDITMPGMKCKTPWDFCGENPDTIQKNLATIRVLGADGRALKLGLQGVSGLKPLSVVVVKGKVAKRDEAGNLVLDASGIHVEKP